MALHFTRTGLLNSMAIAAVIYTGAAVNSVQAQSALLRTINNPSPGVQDNFGRNIMVTDDGLILAGSQNDVGGVINAGNAYLINANTGAIVHTMPNPEPESDVGYSAFSWAGDTRVVVSAFQKPDGSADESGRGYVFNKATGQLTDTLLNPDPDFMDRFGYGVGMLGDTALLGAPGDDAAGLDTGTVYLFDTLTGDLLRTIANPEPTELDNFGYTVAGVGEDKVLVGAPGGIVDGVASAGRAYLMNADTGALIHEFENPHPVVEGFFGFQVRAHGDDLLIGSPRNNKAYLYDGETGALIFQFENPDQVPGDVFGSSIASAGGNIMIGNPQPYPDMPQPGMAYLFSGDTGSLLHTFVNPTPESEDRFGVSVAGVNGKLIISGDQNTVSNNQSSGSIYVFQAPPASACIEWNLFQ